MKLNRARWNRLALAILAPILLLSGVMGLVSPGYQRTSEAPAYDIFHIAFGAVGALLVLSNNATGIRWFNVGFGLVDLYQALASHLHMFPEHLFRWTRTDDAVHIAVGVVLLVVGLAGDNLRANSLHGVKQ
jgi:hypothetical protein